MATFRSSFWLATAIVLRLAAALQVTPDSPCAAVCLDADNLDKTDPGSSNTKSSDIVCDDDLFSSTSRGRKFQQCLTCLQDSSYARGKESDQAWFLYNLRYSVNYCVFGFPNNTEFGSNPCITSEACGPLSDSLREGILEPAKADTYDYCDAGGDPTLGSSYDKCLQCVHAGSKHYYMSNFLTALEAGCRQQPALGTVIGLNGTVFSITALEIIDPRAPEPADKKPAVQLSTPIIAAIAVGASLVLVALAACFYLRHRKRKNRASRIRRRRASPLSFQCQTHLTPRDPNFHIGPDPADEKPYVDPAAALSSNPVTGPSPWQARGAAHDGDNGPVSRYPNISVTTCLPTPPAIHSSPQRASPDDYASPQSATSTRSNAPLLRHKPYVPSEYANSPPQQSVPSFSPVVTTPSTYGGSPSLAQLETCWEDQQLPAPGRDLTRKQTHWAAGANVEAKVFPTSFPPPPKR
ncbi:hypothetical protein HJFPF1_11260 [Paramyrothecium foliicola]|nr:hypothetical protein HJFPF1_11260 [Paramyrothecium foliicola]